MPSRWRPLRLNGPFSGWILPALLVPLMNGGEVWGEPQPRRPLRIVQPDEPRVLDPHTDPTAAGSSILFNVFEGLVRTDRNGEPAPSLAVRWEPAGPLAWRFQLRDGVLFHDGRAMTAKDVVFSLERARDHRESQQKMSLESFRRIEAEGDRAVRIEAGEPGAILFKKLARAWIVPAGTPETITEPLGTGPYRIVDHRPQSLLRLQAFLEYWRSPAKEAAVEFLFVEDAQEGLRLLREGEVDIVVGMTPAEVAKLESDREFWVASLLGGDVLSLVLSVERPPFDDPLVRQAVDLALDRQAIARSIYRGYARPASHLAGQLSFGFLPDMEPVRRDVETARLLLQVAGHRPDQVVRLEAIASNSDLAELMEEQLAEIGMRVETVLYPWPELLQRMYDRSPQAFLVGWSDGPLDLTNTLAVLVHSGQALESWGRDGPVLDRLIEAIVASTDLEARRRLSAVVTHRVAAARVYLPLVWRLELFGLRREIRWEPRPYANLDLYDIARPKG